MLIKVLSFKSVSTVELVNMNRYVGTITQKNILQDTQETYLNHHSSIPVCSVPGMMIELAWLSFFGLQLCISRTPMFQGDGRRK